MLHNVLEFLNFLKELIRIAINGHDDQVATMTGTGLWMGGHDDWPRTGFLPLMLTSGSGKNGLKTFRAPTEDGKRRVEL
jgi:hypothetical protein